MRRSAPSHRVAQHLPAVHRHLGSARAGRGGATVIDVVIIGGGIAGLSAAFELHKAGVRFLLLERTARLGGVIQTEHVDEFVIDAGPDSLLAQKPAAIDLCRELGLGDRLVATNTPRTAYVFRHGVLHPIPEGSMLGFPSSLHALTRSGLFSPLGKARMAVEPWIPRRSDGRDESIGHFVARRFGREAVQAIAEPLLAGIHAGDVDRLSMPALFPQLVEAEARHGSVLRAARRRAGASDAQGAFRALAGGTGELVDGLARALPAASIRCSTIGAAVTGSGPFQVRTAQGDTIDANAVIVASPAFAAAELLSGLDANLARLCGEIPYASSAAIAFAYARSQIAHPLQGTGFVVPRSEGLTITAGTWISSKWPGRAPEGYALLRAFVGGARDPRALERTDALIVANAARDLRTILDIQGEPLLHRLYRWPRSNPQYEVGHPARVAAIDRALERLPGLFLTGSGYRGVGIPDCVADGRRIGRSAAAWSGRLRTP